MDARTTLKSGIARLREADVPSFTLSAELLLLHVTGRDRTWLYAHPEEHLPEEMTNRFFALISRRAAGEPTQYLTGKQEFWGLEFEVTPAVLIPRPETEHVIEVALDRLALRELRAGRPQKTIGEGLQIADIGTGCTRRTRKRRRDDARIRVTIARTQRAAQCSRTQPRITSPERGSTEQLQVEAERIGHLCIRFKRRKIGNAPSQPQVP